MSSFPFDQPLSHLAAANRPPLRLWLVGPLGALVCAVLVRRLSDGRLRPTRRLPQRRSPLIALPRRPLSPCDQRVVAPGDFGGRHSIPNASDAIAFHEGLR